MNNRVINFRAWDRENKKMQWPCEISIGELQGSPIHRTFEQGSIETCPPNPGVIEDYELMQFTGLLDKNGKEIYEGDVIRINNLVENWKRGEPEFDWRVLRVWWNRYTWSLQNEVIARPLTDYDLRTLEPYELEVIGNIYENPDLI